MEHPFFTTAAATRAEALRWLTIAEKLLSARDLLGSKSFATRAHDADPSLTHANEILAVVDTLLAGDRRIGNNQPDFYSILRLTPQQGGDPELLANQYRSLVLILNPQKNRFPFAEHAFRLVIDAWSVLSNPSRKPLYDKELGFYLQQHQPDPFSVPMPASQQNFIFAQPQVHGGESSSTRSSHYGQVQQVQAQMGVGPMVSGPTREPQNFMGFQSGSNIVFGSGFGSKSSHEPVNNQYQENYSTFDGGYVAGSASGPTHDQLNDDKEKQSQQDYSNAGNKNIHDVRSVSENIEETIENEENTNENVEEVTENEENADRTMEEEGKEEEETNDSSPVNDDELTFWTACPYCYYMYEYPRVYVDCTMRCQNCKMAFQSVVIPSPPPVVDGQDAYFCCWGFMPLGFSIADWNKSNRGASKLGNSRRKFSGPRVYIDDDDIFADISSSSESDVDVDWQEDRERKRKNNAKNVKANEATGTPKTRSMKVLSDKDKNLGVQEAVVSSHGLGMDNTTSGYVTKLGRAASARKQPNRVAKNFSKLDLNVELSNEADEPAPRTNKVNDHGRGEDDNIEGIGFFEGLDELFSSLPVLNVVGEDKLVKVA
ncbi:hypothetical protein OROHE_018969 [Orobanche hederae]